MDRKNFFLYLLPAIPIICLGVTLIVFVFSLEYDAYSSTFPTATATVNPTATVATTGTPQSIATIHPTPVTTAMPSISLETDKERERFFNVIKDVALVVAASIITFSSSYIGGLIQSNLQKQQETRTERRDQVKRYKNYLEWIFKTGQRKYLLDGPMHWLQQFLPKQGKVFEITDITIEKAFADMPLAFGLQALENEGLQREFDTLVIVALGYLAQVKNGEKPDLKTINEKYNKVIKDLNEYAENG